MLASRRFVQESALQTRWSERAPRQGKAQGRYASVQALHPKLRGSHIATGFEYDVVLRKLLGISPLQGEVRLL